MKNHWIDNLKVKDMVLEHKPKLIVELGGGGGDNTDQYLELQKTLPFKLITISDGEMPTRFKNIPNFEWRFAVSYLELPKFEDESIDFASIDTDHNYWTMNEELFHLARKMKKGGIVVLHDTESYRHNSGVMMQYGTKDPYPPEINEFQYRGMGDAIQEHIEKQNFKIIKEVTESAGAMALKRI